MTGETAGGEEEMQRDAARLRSHLQRRRGELKDVGGGAHGKQHHLPHPANLCRVASRLR